MVGRGIQRSGYRGAEHSGSRSIRRPRKSNSRRTDLDRCDRLSGRNRSPRPCECRLVRRRGETRRCLQTTQWRPSAPSQFTTQPPRERGNVFRFTLPNHDHPPTGGLQEPRIPAIAPSIRQKLLPPKLRIRSGRRRLSAAGVAVPKATMHENHLPPGGEHQVRAARKRTVQAKAIAQRVQEASDREFRARILRADPRHPGTRACSQILIHDVQAIMVTSSLRTSRNRISRACSQRASPRKRMNCQRHFSLPAERLRPARGWSRPTSAPSRRAAGC